jgi:hypothetical protein
MFIAFLTLPSTRSSVPIAPFFVIHFLPELAAVQHVPSGVDHIDKNCRRERPGLLRHLAAISVHSLQEVSVLRVDYISFEDGGLVHRQTDRTKIH